MWQHFLQAVQISEYREFDFGIVAGILTGRTAPSEPASANVQHDRPEMKDYTPAGAGRKAVRAIDPRLR